MADSLTAGELTIDLAAVAANWSRLRTVAGGVDTAAMVKADGYGLGAGAVGEALAAAGCQEFFVADVGEAIALRQTLPHAHIFVLAGALPGTLDDLVAHDLIPVLITAAQLERWSARATTEGRPLPASVHLDTGMNRTGLDPDETAALLGAPERLDGFELHHVMSHLASADDGESDQSRVQLERYRAIRSVLTGGQASLANTPGIALGPDFHFEHVRPGVGLYGADPSPGRTLGLAPVVHLTVPVLQTRRVAAGEPVGYSATHTVEGDRTIATLALGYGDGFARTHSSRGYVAFGGHRAPVIGRVSMDLVTVDITDLPANVAVGEGTPAEIIGSTVTLDDVAESGDTIAYEILTSLGGRYRRRYVS